MTMAGGFGGDPEAPEPYPRWVQDPFLGWLLLKEEWMEPDLDLTIDDRLIENTEKRGPDDPPETVLPQDPNWIPPGSVT